MNVCDKISWDELFRIHNDSIVRAEKHSEYVGKNKCGAGVRMRSLREAVEPFVVFSDSRFSLYGMEFISAAFLTTDSAYSKNPLATSHLWESLKNPGTLSGSNRKMMGKVMAS